MEDMFIDLHVHSNCSDGADSVATVIEKARQNNVGTISLSEHYNIGSYTEAKRCAGNDIEVIPGIEISADMSKYGKEKKHVCHILGYYISDSISKVLDEYEINRNDCVLKTLDLLHKRRIDITLEDVVENARNPMTLGRFDIAITLAYLGYASTPQEAYGRYLDCNGQSYVQRKKLPPCELIEKIIEHGGVPVLAHPKSIRLNDNATQMFIAELAEAGLRGIEVFNPNNSNDKREYYMRLCQKHDLIYTVGSDYHSTKRNPRVEIGSGIKNNLSISDDTIVKNLKLEKAKIDDKQAH